MEENEDKKPVESEPKAPEAEPEKPVEGGSEAPKKEGGKLDAIKDKAKVVKQKAGEFMGVKRNRIIVLACSGAAVVALVVGLSVGLTQCNSGPDYSQYKVSDAQFSSAIKFEGDKFTISATKDGSSETNSVTKNGAAVHLKNTSGDGQDVYYTKVTENGSDKYYSYAKEGEYWIRSEDAEKLYDKYASVDVSRDIFNGKLSYQTLSFDGAKTAYTASYNDGENDVSAELYFDSAKLIKAVKSYGGSVYTCTFSETAETISLPTVHTHTFSSAWETKKKATKTTNGIKAHKCTVCGAYDESTQKEYDPFMDKAAYDWDKSLVFEDGDITMRKDLYTYYGPMERNEHYVLNSVRHGDVVKAWQDTYSYSNGFHYNEWVNWYTRVANDTISYGYEYFEYDYDETSGKWSKDSQGSSDNDWSDYAEFDLQGGEDHIENYTYVEDEECYKRTVVNEDDGVTSTRKIYFDFGKVSKCVITGEEDGDITTYVYQFDYSPTELSLPDPDSHEHSWSKGYSSDSLYHWHECACGVRNEKEAHDFTGYEVTKKATKTENGIKSASCAICSGTSGDREYNPYMDSYDWDDVYTSYHHPYVSTVTTEEAHVGTTTVETHYDTWCVKSITHKFPTAGVGSDETVYYTNSGDPEYDLAIKEVNGTWVASPDYEKHFINSALSVFSAYNNGDYGKDKLTLVDDGDNSHYVTADGKVTIYFDLGRIVKLIDETDSAKKKTIEVKYDDIYGIELPEYSK